MRLLTSISENMSKRISILALMLVFLAAFPARMAAFDQDDQKEDQNLDVKEIIFEHLGDGYGWEVPFSHVYRIPLPVIVKAEDGKWFCFSSGDLTEVVVTKNAETGKEKKHLVPVMKTIEKNGKTYRFMLVHEGSHKDKVVELLPMNSEELAAMHADVANDSTKSAEYVEEDGVYYKEYRPLDISITKNVAALFIAAFLVTAMVMSLVNYYKRRGMRAPRKGMGFFEMIFSFVYYDTIKSTLGENTKRFAPYLLTCFFFILTMNIVGLIVIFPGGANLTGNIAVTLVLALMTFVVTNVCGTKHYWKEIFWPDVPLFLKFPLPIMQVIEIFGIFTKPAALCVRLFANMMGGHIIVITLTLLIFIFAAFGQAVAGGATVISVLFSVFMLLLDVLVSFIQAYVFTLLSALFISMAVVKEHEHDEKKDDTYPELERKDKEEVEEEKRTLGKLAAETDMKI